MVRNLVIRDNFGISALSDARLFSMALTNVLAALIPYSLLAFGSTSIVSKTKYRTPTLR